MISASETSQTLVARLTPAIQSAIATIAVLGPAAAELVSGLVRFRHSWPEAFPLGRVRYGLWNAADEYAAAEQVVVCRTSQDVVEIHCHGGKAICELILQDLVAGGGVLVQATDFPLAGDCEFQREAALDLQQATTARAAAVLLDQMHGALSQALAQISARFESDGAAAVRDEVQNLLRLGELGLHLAEPWQVVLAGPPNVGKSSLMNAMAGGQRSIVHSEPGTTRDWVEVLTAIDGWPVALSDTAGVRGSVDEIESEGVRRALLRVVAADLVVLVVDARVGWTETHQQLKMAANNKRTVSVWNKIDLITGPDSSIPSDAVRTSATQEQGIEELLRTVARALVPEIPPENSAVPFRERHVQFLRRFL